MQTSIDKPRIAGDFEKISEYLSATTTSQTTAMQEAIGVITDQFTIGTIINILDLGCGTGNSYDHFRHSKREYAWTGVDIEDSPEIRQRIRSDLNFLEFNGVLLPFPDGSIDLIYSHQVFEHVRHPEKLLQEVHRVLKSGGYFIGSTSHLEPYHSHSLWNFTPLGFITLLKTAGFNSILIRPGIDGITLVLRRLLGYAKISCLLNAFFKTESPLNRIIDFCGKMLKINLKRKNFVKLIFSGHFVFVIRKDQSCL